MTSVLQRLWKPWFVFRPTQLVRRAATAFSPPPPGLQPLATTWGVDVVADPARMIGRSIWTTGIYDIAVSELLARLIDRGDTVIDAGANVGYMTLLAATLAGPEGHVLAFEPHPELFAVIERNVGAARTRFGIAATELHNAALGAKAGTARLALPAGFGSNDGIGTVVAAAREGEMSFPVRVETLDEVLAGRRASVMKMDVEGFEPQVLRGAAGALAAGRIRHIVFEDHHVEGSEVVRVLEAAGYTVFAFGWAIRGLEIRPVREGSLAVPYEAPNFVATLEPEDLMRRCRPRGWRVLSNLAGRTA